MQGWNKGSKRSGMLWAAVMGMAVLGRAGALQAADLLWTGSVSNNWDTTTLNWKPISGGATQAFTTNDNVTFDTTLLTSAPTIVVPAGGITPGAVTINTGGAWAIAFSTGSIGGSTMTVNGVAATTFNVANTYTGLTTINGNVIAKNINALGSTAAGTQVNAGGVLTINTAGTWAENISLAGTGLSAIGVPSGALRFAASGNTISNVITLNDNAAIANDNGTNTINGITNGTSAQKTLTLQGSSTGGIFSGAITDSGMSNALSVVKNGFNSAQDWTLAATNTYHGSTTVNVGILSFKTLSTSPTVAGSAPNSDLTANVGTTINFDATNLTGGTTISTARGLSLSLNGATATFTGTAGANTVEAFTNALSVGAGGSIITVTPNAAKSTTVTFGSFGTRPAGATLLLRGTNLGNATGNGVATVKLLDNGASLNLVGGSGNAATPTISIIPWAVGDQNAGNYGSSFLTYDAANGLRPLTTSEYSASITNGSDTYNNVSLTTSSTVTSATSINALRFMTNTGSLNGAGTLTLKSGALLTTITTNIGTTTPGVLQFGPSGTSTEGIITVTTGNTQIKSNLVGTGGLTTRITSGAGLTLSGSDNSGLVGNVVVNGGGALTVADDTKLGAASNAVYLNNGSSLTAAGSFTSGRNIFVGNSGGTLDTGSNTVTLNGNIGSTTLTANSAILTKAGTGILILNGSNNSFGQAYVTGGTLKVTGKAATRGAVITGQWSSGVANYVIDGGTVTDTHDSIVANTLNVSAGGSFQIINGGAYTVNNPVTAGYKNETDAIRIGVSGSTMGACTGIISSGTLNANGSVDLIVADGSGTNTPNTASLTVTNGTIKIVGNDSSHGLKIANGGPNNTSSSVTGTFILNSGSVSLTSGTQSGMTAPNFSVGVGGSVANGNAFGTFIQNGGTVVSEGPAFFGGGGSADINLNGGTMTVGGNSQTNWSLSGKCLINVNGGNASFNQLIMGNKDAVTNTGISLLNVQSGTLTASTLAGYVFDGTNYRNGVNFTGGAINSGYTYMKLGALAATSSTALTYSGTAVPLTVGDGLNDATHPVAIYNLTGGQHTFYTGLTINTDGYLTGTGGLPAVTGMNLTLNGTIAPSASSNQAIGTVLPTGIGSITSNLGLNAASGTYSWDLGALKDSTNGTAGTHWDSVTVSTGALTLGGTSAIAVNFAQGVSTPDLGDVFWTTAHSWKVLDVSSSTQNGWGGSMAKFAQVLNANYAGGTFSNSIGTSGSAGDIMLSFAPSVQWIVNNSGNASATGNWYGGSVPTGATAAANFLGAIQTAQTVTIDAAMSVGAINIANTQAYTIAGSQSITLDAGVGNNAKISVNTGSHTITAPLVFNSNTSVTINGTSLAISGPISGTGKLEKNGAGVLTLTGSASYAAGTVVNAGKLSVTNIAIPSGDNVTVNGTAQYELTGTAGAYQMNSLTLTGNSVATLTAGHGKVLVLNAAPTLAATAKLDLKDNNLIIHSSNLAVDYDALKTLIVAGRGGAGVAGGQWNGNGLTSSLATNTNFELTGLALVRYSDLPEQNGKFAGQTVDSNSLLVKYTYVGDANLDGQITMDDYLALDTGYLFSGSGYANGDFNYDGAIDVADYVLLDRSFLNQSGTLADDVINLHASWFGGDYLSQVTNPVPEPASLALLGLGAAALLRRRPR